MTHFNTTEESKNFFERILNESAQSGFIRKPEQNADWNGHTVSPIYIAGPECCCICIGGGRDDGRGTAAILAIGFIFSFFVGLFYTANSIQSAVQANRDLKEVDSHLKPVAPQQPPIVYFLPQSPLYVQTNNDAPPTYVPNPYLFSAEAATQPIVYGQPAPQFVQMPVTPSYPQFQATQLTPAVNDLYKDAKVLLEGRRHERVVNSVSLGTLTLGAGLITIALVITAILEANLLTISFGTIGGGIVGIGLVIFLIKRATISNVQEQMAANRIASTLNIY